MTGDSTDTTEACWSRSRWGVVFGVLLVLHAGLVLGLARWPRLHHPSDSAGFSARLHVSGPDALAPDPLLEDPRQFAGPDLQGFSGVAARALAPPEYTLAEWPGRPRWLGAETQPGRLGSAAAPVSPQVQRPWQAPPMSVSGESRAPLLLATNTMVFPRGDLAGRVIRGSALPTVLPGTEVLSPTVVEVGVSPAGEVVIARVTGISGNPEADRIAFAWAQGARFSDTAPGAENEVQIGRLTWGELAFVWRVQPAVP